MSAKLLRTVATGLAAAALAAPAAQASPTLEPGSGSAGPVTTADEPSAVTTSVDQGFDWGSAAIGAGSAGMLILLSLGGAAQVSRRRAGIHGA